MHVIIRLKYTFNPETSKSCVFNPIIIGIQNEIKPSHLLKIEFAFIFLNIISKFNDAGDCVDIKYEISEKDY